MMRKLAIIVLLGLGVGVHAATSIFSIQSNVRATLSFPAAEQIQTIEHIATDGHIGAVPLQCVNGAVSFSVTPAMMNEGKAVFVVNRPAGRDLSDHSAPSFGPIVIDSTEANSDAKALSIPFQPSTVSVQLSDPSGISRRGLQIEVNGDRAEDRDLIIERRAMGRTWDITYNRPQGFALEKFRVTATDRSLLGNRAQFSLMVEGSLAIVKGAHFSGGKALELGSDKAFAGVKLALAAGKYSVEIIGYGPDSGSNSLWMELDGRRIDDAVHLPESKPGISSALVTIDPEVMPSLTVDKSGDHILVIVLREGPAPIIDRMRILQNGKEIAVFEGEDMIPTFPKL